MNLGNLLFPLPEGVKKKIREIEKFSYKLNAVETAVIFNKIIIIIIIIIIIMYNNDNNNNNNNKKL